MSLALPWIPVSLGIRAAARIPIITITISISINVNHFLVSFIGVVYKKDKTIYRLECNE